MVTFKEFWQKLVKRLQRIGKGALDVVFRVGVLIGAFIGDEPGRIETWSFAALAISIVVTCFLGIKIDPVLLLLTLFLVTFLAYYFIIAWKKWRLKKRKQVYLT